MLETSGVVASRKCPWFNVWLREDGILVYRPYPGMVCTEEQAWQVLEVGLQLAQGCARPTLVLMQDIARVERGARECFASVEYRELCSRTALVVGSPVSRVIGSFFLGLNRLKYPCRVFDDSDLALRWLQQGIRA